MLIFNDTESRAVLIQSEAKTIRLNEFKAGEDLAALAEAPYKAICQARWQNAIGMT